MGSFVSQVLGLSTHVGTGSQMGKEKSEAMRTENRGFSTSGAEVESGSSKFL